MDDNLWYQKKIPPNVWFIAGMIQMQLAKRGLEILPKELLIPKFCPRCRAGTIHVTDEIVRCTSCGYGRPNIVSRGYDLTFGEIIGLATELAQHAASGTLMERLRTVIAEPR